MDYTVVKVLNNNAVLARNKESYQVVLMSKGIGYNKKKGQLLDDCGDNRKVFYILDSSRNINKLKQFSCDEEKIKLVTKKIVEVANDRLNIQNCNLYNTLLDHITFAIECIELDLPIDNPFTTEISILYSREYEIAQIAARIIKEELEIDIGADETGFIALHLYSACQNNRIQTTIKNTRVYSEILSLLLKSIEKSSENNSLQLKVFLLSLYEIVQKNLKKKKVFMPLKESVKLKIPKYYNISNKIGNIFDEKIGVTLDDDSLAFIAVDIYRLLNM